MLEEYLALQAKTDKRIAELEAELQRTADGVVYWHKVAQGLAVKCFDANRKVERLTVELQQARDQLADAKLPDTQAAAKSTYAYQLRAAEERATVAQGLLQDYYDQVNARNAQYEQARVEIEKTEWALAKQADKTKVAQQQVERLTAALKGADAKIVKYQELFKETLRNTKIEF